MSCAFIVLLAGVVLLVIALLVLPYMSRASSSGRQAVCKNNINQIKIALQMYEEMHMKLPESLNELIKTDIINDQNLFICPFSKDPSRQSYILLYPGKPRPTDIVAILACQEKHPSIVTSADGETGIGYTFAVMSDYSIKEIPAADSEEKNK